MSGLNPSEISSVLKDKISGLDLKAETKNEGTIVNVSDGIIRIHGMGDVMSVSYTHLTLPTILRV